MIDFETVYYLNRYDRIFSLNLRLQNTNCATETRKKTLFFTSKSQRPKSWQVQIVRNSCKIRKKDSCNNPESLETAWKAYSSPIGQSGNSKTTREAEPILIWGNFSALFSRPVIERWPYTKRFYPNGYLALRNNRFWKQTSCCCALRRCCYLGTTFWVFGISTNDDKFSTSDCRSSIANDLFAIERYRTVDFVVILFRRSGWVDVVAIAASLFIMC